MVDIRNTVSIGKVLRVDLVRHKTLWVFKIHSLLLILLLLPDRGASQFLYNRQLDTQSQAALALSQDVSGARLFQKALDNLSQIWHLRQERILANARSQMRAYLANFQTWQNIAEFEEQVRKNLSLMLLMTPTDGQLMEAKSKLKIKVLETKEELTDLKKTLSKPKVTGTVPGSVDLLQMVGHIEDVLSLVDDFRKEKLESTYELKVVKEMTDLLTRLKTLYENFQVSLPVRPSRIVLKNSLTTLQSEGEHLGNLIRISERRARELKGIKSILDQLRLGLQCVADPSKASTHKECNLKGRYQHKGIAESFKQQIQYLNGDSNSDLEFESLCKMVFLLYNASAISARGYTPNRLARLRSTMEERAYSLRLSAIQSELYTQIIKNGVQRLALFHSGGLRPRTLAELVQALISIGLIPAIATR